MEFLSISVFLRRAILVFWETSDRIQYLPFPLSSEPSAPTMLADWCQSCFWMQYYFSGLLPDPFERRGDLAVKACGACHVFTDTRLYYVVSTNIYEPEHSFRILTRPYLYYFLHHESYMRQYHGTVSWDSIMRRIIGRYQYSHNFIPLTKEHP